MGVRDAVAAVRLRSSALITEIVGPPFVLDVPTILRATGVREIREIDNASLDGRIFREASGYVIELNRKLPPARRAFTLAHELAHTFFLRGDVPAERADGTTGNFDERNEEEYLCDVAAAEMLMPARVGIPGKGPRSLDEWGATTNAFLRRVAESGPSVDSVLSLSKEFGTSITATARRFCEVTFEDIYIGFWRVNPKGVPEFEFGFSSSEVDSRIPRGLALPAYAPSRVTTDAVTVPRDIGLINSAGDSVGPVLTQTRGLRSTGRVMTLSLLNETAKRADRFGPRYPAEVVRSQRKLSF